MVYGLCSAKIDCMKQKLVKGVQGVLSAGAVRQLQQVYHKGRLHILKFRQGNPASDARIIAITGAAGKTTTAQLLSGLLVEAGHKVAVYEPELHGEAASDLWKGLEAAKQQEATFIIIEVTPGLVKSGALDALTLHTVVVVNTCPEARLLLGRAVDYAVIPDDHESGALAMAEHQIASFGESQEADVKIGAVKLFRKGTEIALTFDHHTSIDVATFLVGRANVPNVAGAVAAAYILGAPINSVADGVARLEEQPTNFQYIPSSGPFTTVVDAATSEQSAELVITSGKELAKRRLIVALAINKPHAGFLSRMQHLADRLVVVNGESATVETVPSAQEARAVAERAAKKDDLVLLVGEPFVTKDS